VDRTQKVIGQKCLISLPKKFRIPNRVGWKGEVHVWFSDRFVVIAPEKEDFISDKERTLIEALIFGLRPHHVILSLSKRLTSSQREELKIELPRIMGDVEIVR